MKTYKVVTVSNICHTIEAETIIEAINKVVRMSYGMEITDIKSATETINY